MRAIVLLLAASLAGCQTTGYADYANAIARVAEARADAQKAQTAAMMNLAQFGADPTTRTVAVLMLGLGAGMGGRDYPTVQPPINENLQWASIIVPSLTNLGLGYFGYRLGRTQSNNAADVSIAGYGAMNGIAQSGFNAVGAFKPVPFDWSNFPVTNQTRIDIGNRDGQVVIGGDGTQDNSTRPIAIVPPVTVVPVVVTNP